MPWPSARAPRVLTTSRTIFRRSQTSRSFWTLKQSISPSKMLLSSQKSINYTPPCMSAFFNLVLCWRMSWTTTTAHFFPREVQGALSIRQRTAIGVVGSICSSGRTTALYSNRTCWPKRIPQKTYSTWRCSNRWIENLVRGRTQGRRQHRSDICCSRI